MPPEKMAERNLEAKLILIGEVRETGKILLSEKTSTPTPPKGLFVLKVLHVVKGFGIVNPGDLVRIVLRLPPKSKGRLCAEVMGSLPVRTEVGDLTLVYIDPSHHPGFYRPVAAGSSVVIIEPPAVAKVPTGGRLKNFGIGLKQKDTTHI